MATPYIDYHFTVDACREARTDIATFGKVSLEFIVAKKLGRDPFLCTFPGHWRLMKGELIVEAR